MLHDYNSKDLFSYTAKLDKIEINHAKKLVLGAQL